MNALAFGRDLLGGVDLRTVDVADRGDIHDPGLDELAHVAAAALAGADQAELHALVGAVHTRVGKRSRGSHAAEKCPAWDIVFRHDKIICRISTPKCAPSPPPAFRSAAESPPPVADGSPPRCRARPRAAPARPATIEQFVGDARRDLRAVAPGKRVLVRHHHPAGLFHRRANRRPIVRRQRAQIEHLDAHAALAPLHLRRRLQRLLHQRAVSDHRQVLPGLHDAAPCRTESCNPRPDAASGCTARDTAACAPETAPDRRSAAPCAAGRTHPARSDGITTRSPGMCVNVDSPHWL